MRTDTDRQTDRQTRETWRSQYCGRFSHFCECAQKRSLGKLNIGAIQYCTDVNDVTQEVIDSLGTFCTAKAPRVICAHTKLLPAFHVPWRHGSSSWPQVASIFQNFRFVPTFYKAFYFAPEYSFILKNKWCAHLSRLPYSSVLKTTLTGFS
jgi:hypothetical protein